MDKAERDEVICPVLDRTSKAGSGLVNSCWFWILVLRVGVSHLCFTFFGII